LNRRTPAVLIAALLLFALGLAGGECGDDSPAGVRFSTINIHRYQTNCYVIWGSGAKEAVIVDPGGDADKIAKFIDKQGLTVLAIALTHGHYDHVGAAAELAGKYDAEVWRHPDMNWGISVEDKARLDKQPSRLVDDGDVLEARGFSLTVLHTPGHSPGSICFYLDQKAKGRRLPALFTGDLLFKGTVGRSDLGGGDGDKLNRSLAYLLESIVGDAIVLPGHGPESTLDVERKKNPYLKHVMKTGK